MPLKNWSVVANDNNAEAPYGAKEGLTMANVNNVMRQIMAETRTLAAEDTIASATTCDLGTKDAMWLTISGTTTITSFGTLSPGIYKFVRFSGALTLTHNATSLILLTGANRTTVAGDCALFKSEGSGNWREYFYSDQNDYQPLDTQLTDIAALAVTDGNIIVGNGTTWVAESGATARASLGIGALMSFKSNGFAAGTTEYMDGSASHATSGNANAPLPYACTIKNLFVVCAAAPGAGQTYTYTLFKNGVAQTLTCTISNTGTSASDTSNTVTFAAGDLITLRAVSSASAATTIHHASVEVVK